METRNNKPGKKKDDYKTVTSKYCLENRHESNKLNKNQVREMLSDTLKRETD